MIRGPSATRNLSRSYPWLVLKFAAPARCILMSSARFPSSMSTMPIFLSFFRMTLRTSVYSPCSPAMQPIALRNLSRNSLNAATYARRRMASSRPRMIHAGGSRRDGPGGTKSERPRGVAANPSLARARFRRTKARLSALGYAPHRAHPWVLPQTDVRVARPGARSARRTQEGDAPAREYLNFKRFETSLAREPPRESPRRAYLPSGPSRADSSGAPAFWTPSAPTPHSLRRNRRPP